MRVKVIKRYADKYTGELMEEGRKLELSPERVEELINGGYVEEVKEKPKKSK